MPAVASDTIAPARLTIATERLTAAITTFTTAITSFTGQPMRSTTPDMHVTTALMHLHDRGLRLTIARPRFTTTRRKPATAVMTLATPCARSTIRVVAPATSGPPFSTAGLAPVPVAAKPAISLARPMTRRVSAATPIAGFTPCAGNLAPSFDNLRTARPAKNNV
jgi:hypothetical protein